MPLHPLIVHFPIALGVLLPVLAFIALRIERRFDTRSLWLGIMVVSSIYLATAIFASELGNRAESQIENRVSHDLLEQHEDCGEMIPFVAASVWAISIWAIIQKKRFSKYTFLFIALLGVIPLILAGHSGGRLVYEGIVFSTDTPKVIFNSHYDE